MIAKIFWYFLIFATYINGEELYDCDSKIFCYGKILEKIQLSDPPIYKQSADFVEMKLKNSPKMIFEEFEKIEESIDDDESLLESFAHENFEADVADACSNFKSKKMPDIEKKVTNEQYRDFASTVSGMWTDLVVQTSDHVKKEPQYHSMIHLPHCFVKSDEFTSTMNYYDSYWVFRGLLANGLTNIAAGMIENYAHLIRKHKFVLHSNRVYSSTRTQLPLLASMMENYLRVVENSSAFLLKHLEAMETEFLWWTENRYFTRSIKKKSYKVFQYHQKGDRPRPELFKKDYQLSLNAKGDDKKDYFFSAVRAMDETGFGFCSRFKRDLKRTSTSILVRDLVPVELNSVLARYAFLLAQWFKDIKNDIPASKKYEKFAKNIQNIVNKVLWSENEHMWLDWDLSRSKHAPDFTPTNLMPLFTKIYPKEEVAKYTYHAMDYLLGEGIIDTNLNPMHWIIPTSTRNTGEIWDFPYGSPPLNLFIIEGLAQTGQDEAKDLSLKLTKALMKTIFMAYGKEKTMFKLYSAIKLGEGVNERITAETSRAGYAWTNGAILTMFEWYGKSLHPTDFKGFKPSLRHADPIDQKTGKPKRRNNRKSDDEAFGPQSNLAQPTLERMASKISNYDEPGSSSTEVPLINLLQQKPKGKGVKSETNEGKKKLQKKDSKLSEDFEPPINEAAMSELAPRKRRRRKVPKKFDFEPSEPPSNETTMSEQPRKKKVVRKASKQFVEESDWDEPAPADQTSKKKRGRKLSRLSDDEEPETPLNEIPLAEQPQKKSIKRRKSSKPQRSSGV